MSSGIGGRLLPGASGASPRRPEFAEDDASPARGGELGVAGASDPLMDLALSHPEAAVGFMRAALLIGLIVGALLPIPCFAFLGMAWEVCEQCNRPLHLWVLVHCGLNLLQVPARLHFYLELGRRPDAAGVRQVVQSGTWRGCKTLSTAGYAWLTIGVVWLVNSNLRGPCRGIYLVSLGLVCSSLLKALLPIAIFRRYVPAEAGEAAEEAPRGASAEVIGTLPVVEYLDDGRESSCAVCLVDFEEGEGLRRLPCGHRFHASCVDTWLARCSRCPLCMQEVERAPATAGSCSGC